MRLAKLFVVFFAAFLFVGSANATSANTDISDIWWNPGESGWGMQIVNTGTFAYVTIYVYGADRKPVWFGGGVEKVGTSSTFTGNLYATTGPYYGAAFNPAAVNVRQVGTMTFVATSVNTGQFTYSVDGVVVNKSVERQPLTLDFYGGNYAATLTLAGTNCFNPSNNTTVTVPVELNITQAGSQMKQVWNFGNGLICTYQGTYSQLGRMGTFFSPAGTSSCTNGGGDILTMLQMTNEPFVFMARIHVINNISGCISDGEEVGLIPR